MSEIGHMTATVTLEGDAAAALEQLDLPTSECRVESASVEVNTGREGWEHPWFCLSTISAGTADKARLESITSSDGSAATSSASWTTCSTGSNS